VNHDKLRDKSILFMLKAQEQFKLMQKHIDKLQEKSERLELSPFASLKVKEQMFLSAFSRQDELTQKFIQTNDILEIFSEIFSNCAGRCQHLSKQEKSDLGESGYNLFQNITMLNIISKQIMDGVSSTVSEIKKKQKQKPKKQARQKSQDTQSHLKYNLTEDVYTLLDAETHELQSQAAAEEPIDARSDTAVRKENNMGAAAEVQSAYATPTLNERRSASRTSAQEERVNTLIQFQDSKEEKNNARSNSKLARHQEHVRESMNSSESCYNKESYASRKHQVSDEEILKHSKVLTDLFDLGNIDIAWKDMLTIANKFNINIESNTGSHHKMLLEGQVMGIIVKPHKHSDGRLNTKQFKKSIHDVLPYNWRQKLETLEKPSFTM